MIQLDHISLQRGTKPLLDDASLTLHNGQRGAVVGVNGCGKSTLFLLLLGHIQAEAGDVFIPSQWRIAHMQQEIDHSQRCARDFVLDGHYELRELEQAIADAEQNGDFDKLGNLHGRMDAIQGYNQSHIAERIMLGLGFAVGDYDKPVSDFSGGWRIRLNLARTLLSPSDLLLLDEPTNHLDMEAIHWLEQWLNQYSGCVLLVSHDRDFIDASVQKIFHIHDLTIDTYTGSYSDFEHQRAEKLALQQSTHEKQQQRKEEMQRFIDRFRAQANKAKQAQSRIKALEKMQFVPAVQQAGEYHFRIPEAEKTGNPLVNWSDVAVGYQPQVPVLDHCDLSINPGLRLGLLGINGAGKSTLIKTLAGSLPALTGDISTSDHLRIGYFAQHQLEALDSDASPLLHIQRISPAEREQTIRNFLGGFRISGDMASSPVGLFSGGEKARLALAILAWQKPNLLLLDEPTNHLDLEMRQALSDALQAFGGAVILVSHDRYLLRHCVDEFMLVSDGRLQNFDGTLDDYYQLQQAATREQKSDNKKSPDNKKLARQEAARQRQMRAPIQKKIQALEKQIQQTETALSDIRQNLSDNSLYNDENKQRLNELLQQEGDQANTLAELEHQWLEQQELLSA